MSDMFPSYPTPPQDPAMTPGLHCSVKWHKWDGVQSACFGLVFVVTSILGFVHGGWYVLLALFELIAGAVMGIDVYRSITAIKEHRRLTDT